MQKDAFLQPLVVKWPFVGQPDNNICWATFMSMASISTDGGAGKGNLFGFGGLGFSILF